MSLPNDRKMVLAIALSEVTTSTDEELLVDAVDNLNELDVIVMRAIETNLNNSTLEADIKEAFSDTLATAKQFVVYNIGAVNKFLVNFDLTEE